VNIRKVPEKFELFLRLGKHREFNLRTSPKCLVFVISILWIISWILISPYFRSSCIYPWYRGTHEQAWNNKVGGAEERFLSLK